MRHRLLAISLVASLFGLTTVAQALVVEQRTSPNGVPWMSGGVGMEERAAIATFEDEYTLKIITAAIQHEAYAADVTFEVRDASGDAVLQGVADGPWILAKLPPGKYTVAVTSRGETQTQRVNVGGGHRAQVAFYFDRPNT